jgi:CheY-like chemotaxis protein
MFRRRPYNLVITDLIHPGLNGSELIGKIRRLKPWHPVLLFTGSPIPTLAKPCDLRDLAANRIGSIAASRSRSWLVCGPGCRGLAVFPGVRAYAPAVDARSTDRFAGASTIRATPMTTRAATPSSSPRGIKLRDACTAITEA